MKKGLLGSTALIGATALMAGVAGAAEAPTWKLGGNVNFQLYWVDQDHTDTFTKNTTILNVGPGGGNLQVIFGAWDVDPVDGQDHDWYFGVDEAELALNVSGTADNGLNYGFKIEINADTTDTAMADEVRLQLSGSWGTLQLGDEDGAEDIMNYGGENLLGAAGGWDGDHDDVLFRRVKGVNDGKVYEYDPLGGTVAGWFNQVVFTDFNASAPGAPTIAGDTSDMTKVSYFSPRFSGFQVGASITPTPNDGDNFKADGGWENHYGLGANYDNSFGDLRIRASAVYSAASRTPGNDSIEDISAWSVGGIVGWGGFSVGANYTDNGDSSSPVDADLSVETSYWNAAGSFETGPMKFAVGYFSSMADVGAAGESTYTALSLTADYSIAPGLTAYAEYSAITDEMLDAMTAAPGWNPATESLSNDASVIIVGMNVSF